MREKILEMKVETAVSVMVTGHGQHNILFVPALQ